MKNIKLTGKQIKYIISFISIAIFAFSYFYVYAGFVEKTKAAQKEITMVKQYITERESQLSEEATVNQNLDKVNAQMKEIFDSYPVNIAKEDNFMFIEQMEKTLNIKFTSIDVQDSSLLYRTILPIRNEDGTEIIQAKPDTGSAVTNTASTDIVNTNTANTNTEDTNTEVSKSQDSNGGASETENSTTDATVTEGTETQETETSGIETMTGLQTVISLNFVTTYNGFKDLAEYIKDYPDKTVIDSATVSYDSSTGNLIGSLIIKRYALTGTGKVYEPPYINDISIGTDNIFGTGSGNAAVQTNQLTENPAN